MNGHSENNAKQLDAHSSQKIKMTKFNEQRVQDISVNGKHLKFAATDAPEKLLQNVADMRIFPPIDRNGHSTLSPAARVLSRQRRSPTEDDGKLEIEGSGYDMPVDAFHSATIEIENGGNGEVSSIPLSVNNVRYQFDNSDTNDGISDIENQRRKFDVSNLMLDGIETTKATASAKTNTQNDPFTRDIVVTNVDVNEMANNFYSSTSNDETFELITDSFHETLVFEHELNDNHHSNDVTTIPSASDLKSNRKDSDNQIPQPLIVDHHESGRNGRAAADDDDEQVQFNDKINHKPEDIDSTLQNDSPAIIVQYDKQTTLKINHLDTDSMGVVEQPTTFKNELEIRNANASANDISQFNTVHTIKHSGKPLLHSNENSIDGNDYVETLSGIKRHEPRYEMFDAKQNDSIKALDIVQNMQRILVNVSIGTDSGDGTTNHGIYMLHVSVPAGPNLKPAYFDGMPPQTAVHEPPIFIKPLPKRTPDDADATTITTTTSAASSSPQTFRQFVERDPLECGSLTQKSAQLFLECSSEISRLNSIIANLNKTMKCTNSVLSAPQTSSPSMPPTTISSLQSNESLIANETDGQVVSLRNENENDSQTTKTTMMMTTPTITTNSTTVSDYNSNDNRINNDNFCLCNQDIPSILILEGKRFAYEHTQILKTHFLIVIYGKFSIFCNSCSFALIKVDLKHKHARAHTCYLAVCVCVSALRVYSIVHITPFHQIILVLLTKDKSHFRILTFGSFQ